MKMRFIYYLVKNKEIVKVISDADKDGIKQAYKALCDDSEEIDEVEVYRLPFDASVHGFDSIHMYGTNVTIDYLDDDGDFLIL